VDTHDTAHGGFVSGQLCMLRPSSQEKYEGGRPEGGRKVVNKLRFVVAWVGAVRVGQKQRKAEKYQRTGSQSWPNRMMTARSSSLRIAWSTAYPESRCGNIYDILQGAVAQHLPAAGSTPASSG
jgi:hypothetical protein